jgi:hypothetical protein
MDRFAATLCKQKQPTDPFRTTRISLAQADLALLTDPRKMALQWYSGGRVVKWYPSAFVEANPTSACHSFLQEIIHVMSSTGG